MPLQLVSLRISGVVDNVISQLDELGRGLPLAPKQWPWRCGIHQTLFSECQIKHDFIFRLGLEIFRQRLFMRLQGRHGEAPFLGSAR